MHAIIDSTGALEKVPQYCLPTAQPGQKYHFVLATVLSLLSHTQKNHENCCYQKRFHKQKIHKTACAARLGLGAGSCRENLTSRLSRETPLPISSLDTFSISASLAPQLSWYSLLKVDNKCDV